MGTKSAFVLENPRLDSKNPNWILHFFSVNRLIKDHPNHVASKGREKNASVPLRYILSDLRLICFIKKYISGVGFENPILEFPKEAHHKEWVL